MKLHLVNYKWDLEILHELWHCNGVLFFPEEGHNNGN